MHLVEEQPRGQREYAQVYAALPSSCQISRRCRKYSATYHIYYLNHHTGRPREIHQHLRGMPEGIRKIAVQGERFRQGFMLDTDRRIHLYAKGQAVRGSVRIGGLVRIGRSRRDYRRQPAKGAVGLVKG